MKQYTPELGGSYKPEAEVENHGSWSKGATAPMATGHEGVEVVPEGEKGINDGKEVHAGPEIVGGGQPWEGVSPQSPTAAELRWLEEEEARIKARREQILRGGLFGGGAACMVCKESC